MVALSAVCIGKPDTTGLTLVIPEGRLDCNPSTSTIDEAVPDLAEPGRRLAPFPVPGAGTLTKGGGLLISFLSRADADVGGTAPGVGAILFGEGTGSTSAITTSSALFEDCAGGRD